MVARVDRLRDQGGATSADTGVSFVRRADGVEGDRERRDGQRIPGHGGRRRHEQPSKGQGKGEAPGGQHERDDHDVGETFAVVSETAEHGCSGDDVEDLFDRVVELGDAARDERGGDLDGRDRHLGRQRVGRRPGGAKKPVHPLSVGVKVSQHGGNLGPAGLGQGEPVLAGD